MTRAWLDQDDTPLLGGDKQARGRRIARRAFDLTYRLLAWALVIGALVGTLAALVGVQG